MLDVKELESFIKSSSQDKVQNLRGGDLQKPFALKDLKLKGSSFDKLLRDENFLLKAKGLKFSGHATNRLFSRNINFSEGDRAKISEGIDKLSEKGAKDALMLIADTALIVNVKNKTVVTALDKNGSSGEGIFTNIDATMIL